MVTAQVAIVVALPLVYPVVVFRSAGTPLADIPPILSWGLIVLAGAALLQAARKPVGTGYLLPSLSSAIYLQPSIAAVGVGGRATLAAMTIVAGAFESGFGTLVTKFRQIFPPLVTGVIVLIVGIEIGLTAVNLGVEAVSASEASAAVEVSISVVAFLVILAGVVWGNLWIRNLAPIAGVVIGTTLSLIFISLPADDRTFVAETPLVGLPGLPPFTYSFDRSLVIPFLVVGLAAGLRTIGVVMTLDQAARPESRTADYDEIRRGVRNDGIGSMAAGVVGFMGISSAPSAIGVSVATGIMSRVVAATVAAVLVLLALSPKALSYLVTAPAAVVSALLIYYASFMIVAGIRLVTRQKLDVRATFVVGLSLTLALSARVYGLASSDDSDWLTLITSSMMTLGALTAVGLTILFRVGARRQSSFVLELHDDDAEVATEIEQALHDVGAASEAADSAEDLTAAAVREIVDRGLATGPVRAQVRTDDLSLDIRIEYDGTPLSVESFQPLTQEQLTDENVFALGLSHYFDVPRPDDVTVTTRGDHVHLRFVYYLL